MKVVVTGTTSMLGRAVVAQLVERGDDVTCFQRSDGDLDVRTVRGDVRDRASVLDVLQGQDAVVHLAALVAPRPQWSEAYATNVTGTRNVLDGARSVGRFVHISTPSVAFHERPAAGEGAEPPRYRGRDAYTRSKAIAERMVLTEPDRPPTVVIRPHLVWGPGDTQLVGRIVGRAQAGRLVLPDGGRALIDTTYSSDAGRAIVAALDHCVPGSPAIDRAWVVTGDDPRPVRELVLGIVRAAGVATRPRSLPAPLVSVIGRLVDVAWRGDEPPLTHFAARQLSLAHWFDQRATQQVLGWTPQVSVDEGLRRLAESFAR